MKHSPEHAPGSGYWARAMEAQEASKSAGKVESSIVTTDLPNEPNSAPSRRTAVEACWLALADAATYT